MQSCGGSRAPAGLQHTTGCRNVTSDHMSELLHACRVLGAMGAVAHTTKFIRSQRFKHPGSEPLMLLLGHCYSSAVGRAAAPGL
jgi:hypothetical protein